MFVAKANPGGDVLEPETQTALRPNTSQSRFRTVLSLLLLILGFGLIFFAVFSHFFEGGNNNKMKENLIDDPTSDREFPSSLYLDRF